MRAFAAEERECVHYQSSTDKVAKANTHLGLHIGLFQGTVIDKKKIAYSIEGLTSFYAFIHRIDQCFYRMYGKLLS